jgi:hypothetical protein
MRLTCPLCGPRDRREFYYYGADDYLDRPRRCLAPEAWDDYLHLRTIPRVRRGIFGITNRAARSGCEILSVGATATPSPMRSFTVELVAAGALKGRCMRIAGKGIIDRTKPLRFRFDGRDLWRVQGRYAGLGAAGQWRASLSGAASNTTARAAC